MIIEKKAYAKVNLGLRVLSKRPDGFHPLKTIFHLIDLHDVITLDVSESEEPEVTVKGNEDYLPPGGVDLMEKAARLFSSESGIVFRAVITIEKHIPSQAGLGGGSSDASAVLTALNEHFGSVLSHEKLMELSLTLGSDVPFFTSALAAAYGEGRGEILQKAEPCDYPCIIVRKKGDAVSTREAFRILDERANVPNDDISWPLPLPSWRGVLVNDFDIIQGIRREDEFRTLAAQASYDSTTGSGSCQILVFENEAERDAVMAELSSYELIPTRLMSLHRA